LREPLADHVSGAGTRLAEATSMLNEKNDKEAVAAAEQAIKLDQNRWEAYVLAASGYSAQALSDDHSES